MSHSEEVGVVSRRLRPIVVALVLAPAVTALLFLLFVASRGGTYQRLPPTAGPQEASSQAGGVATDRLTALAPQGVYLVVDSYRNQLRLYRRGELLREAVCSTGSGTVLRDPASGREWVFDTPHGERRVVRKQRDPVWIKPDWAFVEEGFEPPRDGSGRYDPLALGDYALYLGDGYIIHGTLFQTLLGRRVTHGCIRLGDEDLEYVYRTVPLGSRVFLY